MSIERLAFLRWLSAGFSIFIDYFGLARSMRFFYIEAEISLYSTFKDLDFSKNKFKDKQNLRIQRYLRQIFEKHSKP